MIFAGTPISIPDVIKEYVEILPFLWNQRNAFLNSERLTLRDLIDHDERIAANTDGLVLAGLDAEPLLIAALNDSDADAVVSSAFVMLCSEQPQWIELLFEALNKMQGPSLEGLSLALCMAPIKQIQPDLYKILESSSFAAVSTTCLALSFHGAEISWNVISRLLNGEEPAIRQKAWESLAYIGSKKPAGCDDKALNFYLKKAIASETPEVKKAAVEAAIWTRQSWLLDYWRKAAQSVELPDFYSLEQLAILATDKDFSLIKSLINNRLTAPQKYRIAGIYGNPLLMDEILSGMRNDDPLSASAAGAAFYKITGINVESGVRVPVLQPGQAEPDEFEKEFLDEVTLPDPDLAEKKWENIAGDFSQGTRFCRGMAVNPDMPPDTFDKFDLTSRREAYIRAYFNRIWSGEKSFLERLQ
ncbi:MAG TPA: hypothetical protein VHP36_07725 [Chitinispirillaceae bacterium]|nr:hypothetical protein [Chitinispirillaceae bacterium]